MARDPDKLERETDKLLARIELDTKRMEAFMRANGQTPEAGWSIGFQWLTKTRGRGIDFSYSMQAIGPDHPLSPSRSPGVNAASDEYAIVTIPSGRIGGDSGTFP